MTESKNTRIFSVIAAVCAALTGIFTVCYCMALKPEELTVEDFFSDWFHCWKDVGYVKPIQIILPGILCFGLAVLLLIGKKNIGFSIVSGLLFLSAAFNIFRYLQFWGQSDMDIQDLFWLLSHGLVLFSYASLFVLSLLHRIPATKERIAAASVIHFVPAGLFFLGKTGAVPGYSCEIICDGLSCHFEGFRAEKFFFWYWDLTEWLGFGFPLVFGTAMMVFLGIWLIKTVPVQKPAHILGQADRLQNYKELLDSEIITREEFEEKKKEILGS